MDQVLLSRIQFAATAGYHFIFVPITIGIGLIMAIFVTGAYRSRKAASAKPKDAALCAKAAEDDAIARMWVRIYTATFAIGVATGITMEFSFGTNWAAYSRFVGDIFGAPLAAEALFAFFLESIFLGFVIFGRNKISPLLYCVSAWLTFVGSALSALWILIANSWMQTPAGGVLSPDGTEAVITDFFAAAFNPSTLPRYAHTVLAVLVMGAFVTIAVAAWYMYKSRKAAGKGGATSAQAVSAGRDALDKASREGDPKGNLEGGLDGNAHGSASGVNVAAARKMLVVGVVVGIISTCCLLISAHSSAVEVWEEQPTKMAMMEGLYETEVPGLAIAGAVDEQAEELTALEIPGGTSFLATGTWDTEYPGLNDLAETEKYSDVEVSDMPVNFVFQVYHIMVACFGAICLVLILALIFMRKGAKRRVENMGWLQWLLIISPIFPFFAIQCGWLTAEVGRQPYVVYPSTTGPDGLSLLTSEGTSASVQSFELVITLALFAVVYLMLLVGWIRVVGRFIKAGPVYGTAGASEGDSAAEAGMVPDDEADISFKTIAGESGSGKEASSDVPEASQGASDNVVNAGTDVKGGVQGGDIAKGGDAK